MYLRLPWERINLAVLCWDCGPAPCGYDCRIVFSIEIDEKTGCEVIILHDIGTHDEVY